MTVFELLEVMWIPMNNFHIIPNSYEEKFGVIVKKKYLTRLLGMYIISVR